MTQSKRVILLVEDDENDVFIMKRVMSKANLDVPLHVAPDGRTAIEYLSGTGQYTNRADYPLPELIFLDLKLPYVNGFEVLAWIRKQPSLRQLGVFVLTSSPEDRDRAQAEELGVKGYLVKPPTQQMLAKILKPASRR
jgi:CheY-like chemotaxis protein